jgi:hypothetical protein
VTVTRRHASARTVVFAIALGALVAGSACGEAVSEEHVVDEPVTIAHPDGSDTARLTLTADAVERLGIRTEPIEASPGGLMVPSGAVIIDAEGSAWVYTAPEPEVFVRAAIDIRHEDDAVTFVAEGPPAGTEVVTVGVPELYGAEFEVGH